MVAVSTMLRAISVTLQEKGGCLGGTYLEIDIQFPRQVILAHLKRFKIWDTFVTCDLEPPITRSDRIHVCTLL